MKSAAKINIGDLKSIVGGQPWIDGGTIWDGGTNPNYCDASYSGTECLKKKNLI